MCLRSCSPPLAAPVGSSCRVHARKPPTCVRPKIYTPETEPESSSRPVVLGHEIYTRVAERDSRGAGRGEEGALPVCCLLCNTNTQRETTQMRSSRPSRYSENPSFWRCARGQPHRPRAIFTEFSSNEIARCCAVGFFFVFVFFFFKRFDFCV